MSVNEQTTLNFLVPAQGGVNVLSMTLPADSQGANYEVNFQTLAQTYPGISFIPQACTVDASNLANTDFITFSIPQINFNRIIPGGTTPTFQFPALQNLDLLIIPSNGTASFSVFFYNYPALPDNGGVEVVTDPGSLTVLGQIATNTAQLLPLIGTDYSANAATLFADLLATIPANASRNGYVVQNQSASAIQVVFSTAGAAPETILILAGAAVANSQGGSLDYAGMPHSGEIQIYGTTSTQQVAARDW